MKLRPITLMAVLMAVLVLVVGLVAWRHRDGSVAAGQPAELPIRAEVAAPAAAAMAPASTVGADEVTYVAAAGLPALDGTAHAWKLAPIPVTSSTVHRLADALGVSGPMVAQGDGWTVAGAGARTLTVTASLPSGPWTWTMTGVAVSLPAICAVPMTQPATGTPGPVPSGPAGLCDSPTTTVPAAQADPPPSSAQAEARARSILTGAGYDLSGWTVSSTVSGDVTQVTATPGLDGASVDTATWGSASVGASLYFAPGDEVSSGSGSWAQPVQVDAYPLIGTAAGIEALNQGRGLPGVEPMVAASGQAGQSAPVTVTTTAGATSSPPDGPTTTECLPTNGVTQPCVVPIAPSPPPRDTAPVTVTMAPRQVRLDRAELVLEPMPGTDGATWLVPAYRFTSSTSPGTWTVLAIDTKWFDPSGHTGSDTTATVIAGGGSSGSTPGSSAVSTPASSVPASVATDVATEGTAAPVAARPSAPTG